MKSRLLKPAQSSVHHNRSVHCAPSAPENTCPTIRENFERVKSALLEGFQPNLSRETQQVALAIREAEALAWQTGFPHLFFPTLAAEKAESTVRWFERQRELRQQHSQWSLAE